MKPGVLDENRDMLDDVNSFDLLTDRTVIHEAVK